MKWWDIAWAMICTPFHAIRSLFPFTPDGRSTLVYLVFAGAGPALTLFTLWIMRQALSHNYRDTFDHLAWLVGGALLIIVSGLGMYVSIRAVKLGKDGFEAGGWRGNDDDKGATP